MAVTEITVKDYSMARIAIDPFETIPELLSRLKIPDCFSPAVEKEIPSPLDGQLWELYGENPYSLY